MTVGQGHWILDIPSRGRIWARQHNRIPSLAKKMQDPLPVVHSGKQKKLAPTDYTERESLLRHWAACSIPTALGHLVWKLHGQVEHPNSSHRTRMVKTHLLCCRAHCHLNTGLWVLTGNRAPVACRNGRSYQLDHHCPLPGYILSSPSFFL